VEKDAAGALTAKEPPHKAMKFSKSVLEHETKHISLIKTEWDKAKAAVAASVDQAYATEAACATARTAAEKAFADGLLWSNFNNGKFDKTDK